METSGRPWSLDHDLGFRASLASTRRAPYEARERASVLTDVLPIAVITDLRAILSELVANCVLHGTGRDIDVTVGVSPDGVVRGCVNDGGTGPVAIARDRPIGAGGLGLRLVDALSSRWGVEPNSSDVWFEVAPAGG
jgi:anti-sigma regulatory factor (Ser/Thr protein kinase)